MGASKYFSQLETKEMHLSHQKNISLNLVEPLEVE